MSENRITVTTKEMANELLLPEIIRLIEEGHTVTLPLKGYSMRPFLENGRDKALLAKPQGIEVGDPVLAEISPGRYVLHRIIGIREDSVTLRGDGNLNNEYCTLADVKAKATAFFRKGRTKPDYTSDLKWRAYSWIWLRLFPIRRYLLAFYRRIWLKLFKPI